MRHSLQTFKPWAQNWPWMRLKPCRTVAATLGFDPALTASRHWARVPVTTAAWMPRAVVSATTAGIPGHRSRMSSMSSASVPMNTLNVTWAIRCGATRCVVSLKRHVMRYQQGLRDEDHLAAILFNAMALIHYEEMIERGVLPAELNDMPDYQTRRAARTIRKAKSQRKNRRGRK